jgi:hypothetical protein
VKGGRLQSNIVIFTRQFEEELLGRTEKVYREMGDYLFNFINQKCNDIRSIGFKRSSMSKNALLWQMTAVCLLEALIGRLEGEIIKNMSVDSSLGYFWGLERRYGDNMFDPGIDGYSDKKGSKIIGLDYHIFEKKNASLLLPLSHKKSFYWIIYMLSQFHIYYYTFFTTSRYYSHCVLKNKNRDCFRTIPVY